MEQIVTDWNPIPKWFPEDRRTDELIGDQARRTPGSTALSMGNDRLTYAQLDARAEALASHLRAQGVKPQDRVGICLERSFDMVVALLAVMKAGATYVPLDPAFPSHRLRFMAQDSEITLTLTRSDSSSVCSEFPGSLVLLDEVAPQIAATAPTKVVYDRSATDLAYILYTSGSTGTPKGVEVPHRALTNFLWSMRESPGCRPDDTLLAITTLSFDISGLEIYLPLTVGARVEIASRSEVSEPILLRDRIAACGASILQATPATWRILIESGWAGDPRLTALCGGETLSPNLAEQLLERCGVLWNMYGPTETTIWSCIERIERQSKQRITIGRPIANTSIHILDSNLRPVPKGTAGELCIGGYGVARGYRNLPELTAERFVEASFGRAPVERIYRTGDAAQLLPDGRLLHLGRIDSQVKIRGFRVEPGEIESVLMRHPEVAQCVVVGRPDSDGQQQLVCYLVAAAAAAPHAKALRNWLEPYLPSYMIPTRFVCLESIPLTANNKIDFNALRERPVAGSSSASGSASAPASPLELQLTALWRQVLGHDSVGIHDDFFDVGGNSLRAVELFSNIREVFGKQLPLSTLFEAPSIAQLARVLAHGGVVSQRRCLVAIQPKGRRVPFFAVPGVGGDVLVFARLAKLLGPDQPFFGMQARGLNAAEAPFTSVVEAARHYVAEIRSVRPRGPYFVGGTCTGGVFAYEMAQQLAAQGEKVTLVLLEVPHPTSYSRAGKVAHLLWPVRFWISKLELYAKGLAGLPLRDWGSFLSHKARRLAAVVTERQQVEMHPDGTSTSARVMWLTLQAVAAYDPKPYAGTILNVIAARRTALEQTACARELWMDLSGRSSRIVTLPAEDSGRLFVSPHVEKLAEVLAAHATAELPAAAQAKPELLL